LKIVSLILLLLRGTMALGLPYSQMTAQADLAVFSTVIVLTLGPVHLMGAALLVLLFQLLKMNVLALMTVQVALQSDMFGHCLQKVLPIVRLLIHLLVRPQLCVMNHVSPQRLHLHHHLFVITVVLFPVNE
jgi:ABC-type antimicrobial peptide transport system permease subunit